MKMINIYEYPEGLVVPHSTILCWATILLGDLVAHVLQKNTPYKAISFLKLRPVNSSLSGGK